MNNFKKVVCEIGLIVGSYLCGFFDASSAPHWCWVVAFIIVLASTFFLTTFMLEFAGKAIPVVDAAEARHGRWRQNDNGTWSCSECSSWIEDEQHHYARFCLHCGAKMDGEDGDGDGE